MPGRTAALGISAVLRVAASGWGGSGIRPASSTPPTGAIAAKAQTASKPPSSRSAPPIALVQGAGHVAGQRRQHRAEPEEARQRRAEERDERGAIRAGGQAGDNTGGRSARRARARRTPNPSSDRGAIGRQRTLDWPQPR